jgi:hypothetical protein
MEGNARLMLISRTVSLICMGLTLCVLSGACGDSSVQAEDPSVHGEGFRCHSYVRGSLRRILPETSDLSCSAINELTNGIPSEPQVYSILSGSPHLLWKCRLFGPNKRPLLLHCTHQKGHFSIVSEAG